jgi:transcriptional regulator with XRE-family HTH domain
MVQDFSMRWRTLAKRIATNIRRIRKEKGLTQEKAAERASDISWRYWQYLESGERNFSLKTLTRITKALGVDPKDLL